MRIRYFIFDRKEGKYTHKKGFLTGSEAIGFGVAKFPQFYDIHLEIHIVETDGTKTSSVQVKPF